MSHTHGKFLYLSIIKANEKRFAFLRHFYAWNIWWEISLFWTSAHLIAFHIVNKQSIFCGWVVMLILKNIFIFFRCLIIFYLFVTANVWTVNYQIIIFCDANTGFIFSHDFNKFTFAVIHLFSVWILFMYLLIECFYQMAGIHILIFLVHSISKLSINYNI